MREKESSALKMFFGGSTKKVNKEKKSKDAAGCKYQSECIVRQLLDFIALIAVIQYVAYRFLQSTMFSFVYTDLYKYFSLALLIIAGGIRFIYLFFHELMEQDNKKRYILKRILAGCLALPLIYVGRKPDYRVFVFLPFVALNLYNMDSKRVLKWFVTVVGILLSATVICSLTGVVKNLTYYAPHRLVAAYGIINTTDFAAYITVLLLFFWCSRKKKNWIDSVIFIITSSIISLLTFQVTDSRTLFYCWILTILIVLWECADEYFLPQNRRIRKIKDKINKLSIAAFPVICILFVSLMVLFLNKNQWTIWLNNWVLAKRLSLTQAVYEQYGLHPFGAAIANMHGNGGTMVGN